MRNISKERQFCAIVMILMKAIFANFSCGILTILEKLVKKNGQIKKLNFERIHWESSNRYPNEDDQNCSKVRSI